MRARIKREYLYVDGYNIINSWEEIKSLAQLNLEEARWELIEILSEYHHLSGIGITVVFDAYDVKGSNRSKEKYKGIEIVFTKEGETADHYIERVLNDMGRYKRIRVATSDRIEQEIVLSRGGIRVSAKELEFEIKSAMETAKRQIRDNNKRNELHLSSLDMEALRKLSEWKAGNNLD